MKLDVAETLSQLVSIPSVNPMGREVSGPEYGERQLTDHLERLFSQLGLPCERQNVEPGRDNLLARLDGDIPPDSGGKILLFGVHQDTVPVGGMTIPPWTPQISEGRLFGRGACDVKGGMTAMLVALARLIEERPPNMPTIVMACTVNEEHGFTGVRTMMRRCSDGSSKLLPRLPDAAVIAEPTDLDVVVAHKGVVRWKCHTTGRAGHSALPELGENAIYRMAHVLIAIERDQQQMVEAFTPHPLCGSATISVGTIHGGQSVNTIPDRATIEIDHRIPPGEPIEKAYQHRIDELSKRLMPEIVVTHDPPYLQSAPLSDESNGLLSDRLVEVTRTIVDKCRPVGVDFATDAATIGELGVPSVVFGPGSIKQAHTKDEWIELEHVEQAAEILYQFGGRATF